MKCPKCHHENTPKAKFCEECAAPLARTCGNCGNPVSPAAKFCPNCGNALGPMADDHRFVSPKSYTPQHLAEKILTARAGLEGERKQVTVLFADVKGSMELLADLDPEDAQKLIDPVLERMIEAVHRYEGTVNKVMGDGIMALFGAPLAHEDHAIRACYAALRMQETVTRYGDEIQRTHGVPVTIRVGLNSGEIVISAIGNDLRMDYTVVGQTVHLAARMEQMAKPGSVLTTANTLQLAEGYISMRPLGPVPVKGLVDLVQIYEVTGAGAARTRLQAAGGRGLTRFVGRDAELDQLGRALQLAGQQRGQIVALVGEAGVGKSRLVHEFVNSPRTADWLILVSNSVSYGHATPYLPVIELLRNYFQVKVRDSTRSIHEKVAGKILALNNALLDIIPPLLDLLDALDEEHPFHALDPLQHRQATYDAVIRLLLHEIEVQPVVVVFEDLHWNDSLSIGLLNELAASATHSRLLLLVSYRPEYRDDWIGRANHCQLRLEPFGAEDLSQLLHALLGPDPGLAVVRGFLEERASGNPFFAEEIVRALADTGVLGGARGNYRLARPFSSVDVPPTVQAVLAARIDALPASEKHLLQEAAVIGHHVPFILLQEICGLPEDELRAHLDNLQGAEFLYATQLFPDLQYSFKHAFTHDVTYRGLLRDRRRDTHSRVVEAIEKLYADRLGEQIDRLAHHAAGGELQEKAVHYLRQAGAKAAARSALADARAGFEKALAVLQNLPESQANLEQSFELRLELRPVLRQLGEGRHMLEHLRESQALAERLSDDRRLGRVCAFMTTVQATLNELDEALASGNRALEIARRLDDRTLGILAKSYLEQAHYYRGDYGRVIGLASENLAALPSEWASEYFGMAVPPSIFDRAWLILSLAEVGRFSEAMGHAAEAIRIAEPTQHAFTIGWVHFAESMLYLLKGDWAKARLLVENWIALLRTGNLAIHLPWAVASSASVLAHIGERSEALNRVSEGEELLNRQAAREIVGHRGWAYGALGRACLLLDRLDEARVLAHRSIETSQRQPGFSAHALHLLGDIASHPDRFDGDGESGAAHYREALGLAQQHGMRPLIAHCHLGLGRLYVRAGKSEQAEENLSIARSMYREMEMPFWLKQGEADPAAAPPA